MEDPRVTKLATTGVLFVLLAVLPAQASDPPGDDLQAKVDKLLNDEELDARLLREVVEAAPVSVPLLLQPLRRVGGQQSAPQPLGRDALRALRALRLIGPTAAEHAAPTLFEALAPQMERDDVELLDTLRTLATGCPDTITMLRQLREVQLPAPRPQQHRDGFMAWCKKMRLWYDVEQRLAWSAPPDRLPLATDSAKPWITDLLDEDPLRRRLAAERLGLLGPRARHAIDELQQAAEHEHPRRTRLAGGASLTTNFHDLIQQEARRAIARIDPTLPEARPGLALLLQADDPEERFRALLAMSPDGAGEFDLVPAVLAATHDDDLHVAGEAVTTLLRLGDARREVLDRLERLADADDRGLSARAVAALRTLRK